MSNQYLITHTPKQRFDNFISMEPMTGCWLWCGHISRGRSNGLKDKGYGTFGLCASKAFLAHRAAWELYRGPIPKGMSVLHYCDTPSCVNPYHLFLGNQKDNMLDAAKKKRTARGVNHPRTRLTDEEVVAIRNDTRPKKFIIEQYHITVGHIINIQKGKTRKYVP